MTLHWWMHWFWITRPVAVATQLLLLLSAVQTVPLPPSTLYPQHHILKDSVVTSRASVSPQHEAGFMWRSSPEIEEPFYPTASPSGPAPLGGASESIPGTSQNIPKASETYFPWPLTGNKEQLLSENSEENFVSSGNVFLYPNSNVEDTLTDSDISNEPRALPLQAASLTIHENHTIPVSGVAPVAGDVMPKILEHSDSPVEITSKDAHILPLSFNNNTNLSNFHGDRRLVTRDLRNSSDLDLSAASHDATHVNSSRVRTSKAIGSFPPVHPTNSPILKLTESTAVANSDTLLKHRHENVKKLDDVESENKDVPGQRSVDNSKISVKVHEKTVDTKFRPEDVELSDSPYRDTESVNSSNTGSQNHAWDVNVSDKINDKMSNIETNNKTAGNISNSSSDHVQDKVKELIPLASTVQPVNVTSQSKKHLNGTIILNHTASGVTSGEGNSSLNNSRNQLSGMEHIGNNTPASSHVNLGQAASHNYEDETTLDPSVAPVSKSRIAAPSADTSGRGLDAASITGISLGIVVFAGLAGAISFILYRRRYLNKPQTLNDKCSNPDSSGYIDDSTLRENSEEMYSLDNDSFLNSLEAMTIQNYWTDNVKHTKL